MVYKDRACFSFFQVVELNWFYKYKLVRKKIDPEMVLYINRLQSTLQWSVIPVSPCKLVS